MEGGSGFASAAMTTAAVSGDDYAAAPAPAPAAGRASARRGRNAPAHDDESDSTDAKQLRGPYFRQSKMAKTREAEASLYLTMLESADVRPRPSHLDDDCLLSQQIFIERPIIKRVKGHDRWVTSGGRKGATEIWISSQQGICKRYGRLERLRRGNDGVAETKFAQYTLIRRANELAPVEEVRDAGLWVLQPSRVDPIPAVVDGCMAGLRVQSRASSYTLATMPPSLLLRANERQKFVSFEAEPAGDMPDGIELGAIERAPNGGIKLVTAQGDFAEWHRLVDGEPPLSEGDVVGFHRGRISRSTRRCAMLGIVTRKAVIEGSAPPAQERHLYDTVAYQGVVPVKVLNRRQVGASCDCADPRAGQLLVPSGRHDGTAALVSAAQRVSHIGILLDSPVPNEDRSDDPDAWSLMQAVVVTPAETVVGSRVSRAASLRNLVTVTLVLAVALTVLVVTFSHNTVKPAIDTNKKDAKENDSDMMDGSIDHRSCEIVECPRYMERNVDLEYDAMTFFPGV